MRQLRAKKINAVVMQDEVIIRPERSSIQSQIAEFLRFRELLYFLVWKNLKVRYAQAALGVAWSLLQPILTALIMALLLGRYARVPTNGVPPFLFYFAALVPWTFFANAVTTAASSLVTHQQLIVKVYFPRLCLPVAAVLSALVDLIVPLVLLLSVALFYGRLDPSPEVLIVLPALLLIAAMAATGVGVGLAALNLQYRDVQHVLPFLIQILFFASPILYSASQLPTAWQRVYFLNPIAAVLDGFRGILFQTHPLSWGGIMTAAVAATLMLVAGILYFERIENRFADVA
jgi:lipopolysaccharide transport system permease protein